MFRPLVLRRNFSLLNRVPHSQIVRSAARNGHDSIIIQRVRIRRPFFRKTRLVGTVAVVAASYGLAQYLGLEIEIEEIDEGSHAGRSASSEQEGWEVAGTADDEEDEEDDAILFLPTGFARPGPRTYYKGSDPEWQAFKQIANDRSRVIKIRRELIALIRSQLAKRPTVVSRLGKVDTEKGIAWIEFQFPSGPPIQYERPGIELTGSLEWRRATRPVEDAHRRRLDKILYPKATADALYKDTARKAAKAWKNFKINMGWDQESKSETVQGTVQRIGANRQSNGQATSIAPNPFSASANDTQQARGSPPAAPVDGPASVGFVLPSPKDMTLDLRQFRTSLGAVLSKDKGEPPRGTFTVKGLIEVHGEFARMTVNITCVYDPKTAQYVSMDIMPYTYVVHRQAPRGGS